MRSRTELVTHQLEGSDFEDESDFEDSEEDWRPAKGEQKPKKIKTAGRGRKSAGASKNGGSAKRGRRQSRKLKKQSSDEEELSDGDVSEPEPSPPKKSRKSAKRSANQNASSDAYQSASEAPQPTETVVLKSEPTTSMFGNAADVSPAPKPQPLPRKVVTPVKSFPDKGGYLNLFIFKGDLKDGIVNNTQVCLWRRDGSSLLQKYLRDKTVQSELPQYNSSMVYSCWEDKRANEYLEVKVRCLEQSKQIRVELTDVEELEAKSKDEYDSYVATYGTPVPRSTAAQQDDDDDEDCDEDDMAAGEDDGGEEFEEDGENEEAAQEE